MLALGQEPGIAGAMLAGVALLLAGTVALGRGRSWGLFGNFFGAIGPVFRFLVGTRASSDGSISPH